MLLCTWGESGVSALALRSGEYAECPAFKTEGTKVLEYVLLRYLPFPAAVVLTLSSTVGAGDTFIAGMLYGLTCHTDDWTLDGKIEFANELAGRKVAQEGLRGLGGLMQHSM